MAAGRLDRGAERTTGRVSAGPQLPLARHAAAGDITLRHLAYLKIAEGCNRLCSFCSIPLMRGPYASKPIEQVVAEAEELAADGVRELVLVAQDTTFYGLDIYGQPRLAELLRRLDAVDGLAWIRLMYLYPMHITDELIEVVAGGSKVLPYLDLPLQHINDEVLRRMRRRVDRAADRGVARPASPADRLAGAADHVDDRFSGRNRGRSSRNCSILCGGGGSSGWGCLPSAASRAPPPPSLTGRCPKM